MAQSVCKSGKSSRRKPFCDWRALDALLSQGDYLSPTFDTKPGTRPVSVATARSKLFINNQGGIYCSVSNLGLAEGKTRQRLKVIKETRSNAVISSKSKRTCSPKGPASSMDALQPSIQAVQKVSLKDLEVLVRFKLSQDIETAR